MLGRAWRDEKRKFKLEELKKRREKTGGHIEEDEHALGSHCTSSQILALCRISHLGFLSIGGLEFLVD
ncbi:hypothetical protein F0562_008214 [Nyssa sinensis]|uniref:Uncharacterized protein n=1 Tax=Nyssa sinensis TaxID=561372 RepID=A0A5J5A6R8_9ASTE|nr:hypothetical protein F0562_008214 [Nyssa sinensis]